MTLLWTIAFGSLGCVARWAIEELAARRVETLRPFATMGVNILGALMTGVVIYLLRPTHGTSAVNATHTTMEYLLTGFCGGFTTFSSALAIPYLMGTNGQPFRATFLIGATPLCCLVGYGLGEVIAGLFT